MLEQDGWRLLRTKESQRQFKNPSKPGTATVAGKPSLDIPPGTLNAILNQAGLKKGGQTNDAVHGDRRAR
jgi:predicted RNA binding protein YcfA (HicA-like mRNA interferase family)